MPALGASEREELLAALARYVRDDPDPFVSRPIVLPTPQFFPEPLAPSEAGLQRLAQRLLAYAGLDGYRAEVTLADGATVERTVLPNTRVDLAGVERDVVFFTVAELGRADDAALAFAHEIARAVLLLRTALGETYRDATTAFVPAEDPGDDEKREASVLAVHLGLGALGAAGAYAFRQAGLPIVRDLITEHAHVAYGGLAPEAASYLLAIQLCVRDPPASERRAVLGALPVERREEVERELASLDRDTLVGALGLPPPSAWPGVIQPSAVVMPAPTATKPPARRPKTQRAIAFRAARDRLGIGGIVGTTLGLVTGLTIGTRSGVPCGSFLFLVLGTILGLVLGRRASYRECSTCLKAVAPDGKRCAACGARLVGDIESHRDRLGAEERWQRAQRRRARRRARDDAAAGA